MPRRRNSSSASAAAAAVIETITTTEAPIDDLEENTVEDYKKLNDKLDTAQSKIKGRKEKRKT